MSNPYTDAEYEARARAERDHQISIGTDPKEAQPQFPEPDF